MDDDTYIPAEEPKDDFDRIRLTLMVIIEAALMAGLQLDRATAIHDELLYPIAEQGRQTRAIELIAQRIVEVANHDPSDEGEAMRETKNDNR